MIKRELPVSFCSVFVIKDVSLWSDLSWAAPCRCWDVSGRLRTSQGVSASSSSTERHMCHGVCSSCEIGQRPAASASPRHYYWRGLWLADLKANSSLIQRFTSWPWTSSVSNSTSHHKDAELLLYTDNFSLILDIWGWLEDGKEKMFFSRSTRRSGEILNLALKDCSVPTHRTVFTNWNDAAWFELFEAFWSILKHFKLFWDGNLGVKPEVCLPRGDPVCQCHKELEQPRSVCEQLWMWPCKHTPSEQSVCGPRQHSPECLHLKCVWPGRRAAPREPTCVTGCTSWRATAASPPLDVITVWFMVNVTQSALWTRLHLRLDPGLGSSN